VNDTRVRPLALTVESFAPFGDVIQTEGRPWVWINDHTCRRFDDLATVDVAADGGRPLLSVFEAAPRALPLTVHALERHPLSSQAFVPLDALPFLVVVAEPAPAGRVGRVHAFWSNGRQGVNYRANTWHHALIALHRDSRFLVVDRGGRGENCEVCRVDNVATITADGMRPFSLYSAGGAV
jgi:ureidoglycolate lyase